MGNSATAKVMQRRSLLLVDDDPLISDSLAFVLGDSFDVHTHASRAAVQRWLRGVGRAPDVALIDLGLPPDAHRPDEGFTLIRELLTAYPTMKVLVLSGQSERANIQHALSLGAVDFIPKPCDPGLLRARIEHHLMILDAEQESSVGDRHEAVLLGESAVMKTLRVDIERYADTPFPVLVQGESGTGKELVAGLLHRRSERRRAPFLTVNCAAFTPQLLEAQLYGHAKGAYTGADAARAGFFEEAGNGTLFLDEIGEFPFELQSKLLRVLENGEYYRLGETRTRVSRARIVAATNLDLLEQIRTGRFRADLYHRLSVLTISVPPLRQRGTDSLRLLDHFRNLYAAQVAPFELDPEAEQRWRSYTFPGNVRELRNIVIRLGAKFPGQRVGLAAVEAELDSRADLDAETLRQLASGGVRLDAILSGWELRYINAALKLSDGNLSEAARLLGINRTTLYSKVQRLADPRNRDV